MAVAREGHAHLPPGREPGPQSRRTATGRTLGGCAAPAFVVAGVLAAAIVSGFGLLLGSLPGGPPAWPFFLGAAAALGFFSLFARAMWRGARPRAPGRRKARRGARAAVGAAVRLRVEVDGEPLAPGAAVTGRVVVEEGGGARTLSLRLGFVERTADFHKVARDAGTQLLAEGDLAGGAVFAFQLALPEDALPQVATAHARIGWEVGARVDRAGPDPTAHRPVELLQGYTAPDRERWPSG